ncbi:MAG: peptide ABC transporter ATP-binding protein [Blastocatellia bacterium AA13]|nr:MAG: peptide ABC transporter ATP-binding protein [Blastocatellia bacterium AA13]
MSDNILEIRNLSTNFQTAAGVLKAVDDVSFNIQRGATLALVGESGCGKSITGLSIMRLVQPPGRVVSGEIIFEDRDLLSLSREEMRKLRGSEIAMIFQDPMTSLNPVFTVGDQIAEAVKLHEHVSRKQARARAIEMMERVMIPNAAQRSRDYPHQMSGGMRQRIMIAMALACGPRLLIADEPTTALDVTIQAEIIDLLRKLKEEFRLSVLLISHDLGLVAENADSVIVMYCGKIVEQAAVTEIFEHPSHPYTEGLLRSIPRPSQDAEGRRRLVTIEGSVPSPLELPPGCAFAPRCSYVIEECRKGPIPLEAVNNNHLSRCIRFEEVGR